MRIQRLPNPISSFWRGLKAGSSKIEKATNRIIFGSLGHFNTSTPEPPHIPTLVKSDDKLLNNVTTAVESKEEDSSPETRQLVITSGSHSSQTTNGHGSNYYSSNTHSQILNGEVVESSYESSLDDVYNAQYNNKKTSKLGLLLFDRIWRQRLTFVLIKLIGRHVQRNDPRPHLNQSRFQQKVHGQIAQFPVRTQNAPRQHMECQGNSTFIQTLISLFHISFNRLTGE